MALTISDFTRAAAKGSDHVIEVKNQDQVKSSGFFGRTFKSAGRDVETNQATLQAFVDSVRDAKGDPLANVAKAKLTELTQGGKPLSGRMVKAVMQDLNMLQQEVQRSNEQFFQRLIYDQGPDGLKAIMESYMAEGASISPNDMEILAQQLRFKMEACTRDSENMTLEDVAQELESYGAALARVTPEALARLDNFVQNHAQHGLSKGQAQTMRALMLVNGITTQDLIDKTMKFSAACRDILPRLSGCKDGGELMGALAALDAKKRDLFPNDQSLDGLGFAENVMPAAMQGALLSSGYTPERTKDLLASVIMGKPGTEVCCSCGVILFKENTPANQQMLLPFLGMRRMMEDSMGQMVGFPHTQIEVEGGFTSPVAAYDRLDEIPPGPALYLRCLGYPMPSAQFGMNLHGVEAFLKSTADTNAVPAEDIYRLLQSLGESGGPGNLCHMGMGAMLSVLAQLKTVEPGHAPFSPQTVWQQVFNGPLPAGVTEKNLAFSIGATIQEAMDTQLGEDLANRKGPSMMIAISVLGVPWQRAINMAANPGVIRFADLPVPFAFTVKNPSWALEKETLSASTGDIHRREGNSTIRIGGHDPLQLSQPVPSQAEIDRAMEGMTDEEKTAYLERVEQIKDYNHRNARVDGNKGIYNFMADSILAQVTELTGSAEEDRLQRIAVLQALTQSTSVPFRYLSPLARGAQPGAGLYEHSAYNTTVTKDGDLIRIHLETPPNSPMRGVLDFVVDKQGKVTMTDMLIGQ